MLALRDYYRQLIEEKKRNLPEGKSESRIAEEDEWAVEWITINKLQPIAEAFDDDASGFITIAEVNKFTSSRPQGWRCVNSSNLRTRSDQTLHSLPHWLAYWAIGTSFPLSNTVLSSDIVDVQDGK